MRRIPLLLLLLLPLAARAVGTPPPPDAFDLRIAAELSARSPEAAALFARANAARAKGGHAEASRLYGEVLALVPDFVHAQRRQAMEELEMGRRDRALVLLRDALARDRSAQNLGALARVLVVGKVPADTAEALRLSREAVTLAPEDRHVVQGAAGVALEGNDLPLLTECCQRLEALAPDDYRTWYLRGVELASRGRVDDALAALRKSRALGLPEAAFREVSRAFEGARPLWRKVVDPGLVVLAAWGALFVLLFAAGTVLSRATLRAAERLPAESTGVTTPADARLRKVYAAVLWLSCAFYYVSLPLLAASVLAVGGGLIFAAFALGHIPVKLVAIVAVLTLVSFVSILRSVFVRGRDEEPGLKLPPGENPRLEALLAEVAGRVGTRPVDTVYLTTGTELAVFERGGPLRLKSAPRERCLLLGAGVLPGFRLGPFRAVLAHEYGHFSHRDTAGGGLALAVRRSVLTMARHLAQGGAAAWYNPAWLFVNGFLRVFLRISQGASRLQEILADRWAAICYGGAAFAEGLRHVVSASVRFDAHVDATLTEVVEGKRPLPNLYRYVPAKPPSADEVEAAVAKALEAEPSPYDSHPSPAHRVAWAGRLERPGPASADDGDEAWSLFASRDDLERRLTDDVRNAVKERHGVEIPLAS